MDRHNLIFVLLCLFYLPSDISCEISYEKKNKLVNGFIDFYNNLPNQIYTCSEGYLQNAQQSTEQNSYEIEVTLKVSNLHNLESTKEIRCTGKVVDLEEVGVSVLNHHCEEIPIGDKDEKIEEIVVTEPTSDAGETEFVRKPIQLDNEVQTNTAVTSGEQFIAIPREDQKVSCIGCASHVNPQAPGVSELAAIGVRQLNSLEPNVQHTLNSVVDVERQVQVVNGVRYIITLVIDYNSCLTPETETCLDSKTCKITFLEKPWVHLPDGSKYRAILSNNCTEEWRFGDNGVVIPQTPTDSRENNNINAPQTDGSDVIKPIHNVDLQAQPVTDKTLTNDDIKDIQTQIISYSQFKEHGSEPALTASSEPTKKLEHGKEHVVKVEQASQSSPNSIPETNANTIKIENLSEDKKKAIDDMLNFFNFAGFDSARPDEDRTRMKRSYDRDLNIMNLVEKFQKVKKNVENAKYVYKLAQIVVDYLNENDLEVKTRALKDVLNAEEELENHQHFYYIQSRVIIPCDKSECEEKDTISKICNAVLEGTNKNVQILNVFCHDEPKAKPLGKVNSVALDDPVLLKLITEATNKIESESALGKAMKINKIIDANTQRVSGTLTKFSIMLDITNCKTTVPSVLRSNCSIIEELGSLICDVTIHERHWLKERKITYTCTERPVDTSFSSKRKTEVKKSINDPAVLGMVNEALQYLDVQSNRNNKIIVVRVNSVATQLVAGFLTDIEFVVGYTTCTNDVKDDTRNCKLLKDEPLRTCKAKVWDRTWIEDGRQVDVSCNDPIMKDDELSRRVRREVNVEKNGLGASSNKDVNDPEFTMMAEDALRKYLQSSVYKRHFKVVSIHQATVQIVAGTLTKLTFKISPTTCLIDKEGNPSSSDCKVFDHNDVSTCHSEIWEKPWLNFKESNTTCQVDKDTKRVKRLKRLFAEEKYTPRKLLNFGGQTSEDVDNPKIKIMAKNSLQKFLKSSGSKQHYELISIEKVTLLSGDITRLEFSISPTNCQLDTDRTSSSSECQIIDAGDLISCSSDILEQELHNSTDIDVTCHVDDVDDVYNKVKSGIPGGPKEQDINNPMYKNLAEESMHKYLQSNGNTIPHQVLTLDKVSTQIVSGTVTKIDFKISPAEPKTGDVLSCHSEIWEQPWNKLKNIDVDCVIENKTRTKRSGEVVGGLQEQDPNNPIYRKLAEESMHKYLQSNGNTIPHQIRTLNKVSTKVVAGLKTIIDFKISPVNQTTGDVISCHSEIWEQRWNKFKQIDVNCVIDNTRAKREIINMRKSSDKRSLKGGQKDQNPTKIEYKKLAEDSLKKYLKLNKNSNVHSVVEVIKVKTKAVSGTLYNIEYIAALNSCADDISTCVGKNSVLHCATEVWDRPWLGKKHIDVLCIPNKKKTKTRSLELKDIEETMHEEHREKRQTGAEDDYVDEDLSFYYAERAIKQLNDQSDSNNLHKLITIHGSQTSMQMDQPMVRMYIETAETYCLRHRDENILPECEEMNGMDHQLCLVRLWPSPDDELVMKHVSVVCNNDETFESISGLSLRVLLKASIKEIEKSPKFMHKLVHQGEPQLIPSLDSSIPITINFIIATTNCSKKIEIDLDTENNNNCFIDISRSSKACQSRIWLDPSSRTIKKIVVKCGSSETRKKRSISLNPSNSTADEIIIQNLVQESLHKLEMSSSNRYKQRVIQINSYSTKITSGKVTTIDFDVAYTSCLKFEWVEDVKSCEFLEHLPRRHCVSQIWERLWVQNGRNIEVTCEEDETPLEAHVEFESAETAMKLATEALKHIEAKYPHPRRQKVVRIFSLEKQVVAGIHYRMKIEVGSTQCSALSAETDCKLDKDVGNNKFCRVNVWLRPWTSHAPNFRVSCDYQEASTTDLYHHLQAELLFREFLTTYKPEYIDNPSEITRKFEIFKANIQKIHELNIHERGTATYGVTRFADLSYEEFTKKFLGLKPSLRDTNQVPMRQAEIPTLQIPDKFDWRTYDAVTEVKNQGSCGSCWAFSVTGNIEGQWKMQSGQLVSLSEQELVDCDKLDQGCNGGLPDNAYRAIEQLGGLELEKDYPYEGEDDKCSYNKTLSRVKITGAVNITTNETGMAKWLVQNGPISIGINANAMQFYMGGVSHPWKMLCNPTNLDHGVLIVGYGIKDYPLFHKRLPFWTIKNSWGPEWGEQGYYRVYRGDGTCGVNQMASSAVI